MTLNLVAREETELKPRISVFGIGGAGGNAVNNMIDKCLEGCEFVVANTDAQALQQSRAVQKIQLGVKVTEGLGAGARPSVGASAAEESIEEIVDHLAGAHMCFITTGMGGGTGTGAAPIIAQAARELGVLTVGVVTKPFQFEGSKRMRQAEEGVEALQKVVDTLIIIPNQNLFRLANERTTFTEAFAMADDVLYQGVKGVTDLMVRPGLINLDFADVRAVMDEMGKAMMGTGEAEGEERAVQAAEKAIANPLLDEISLRGAKGVLINITGGYDLTLFELDEAANRIREEVDPDANIIVGSTLDTGMEGVMRVSVVATGIDVTEAEADVPVQRRRLAEPLPQGAAPQETETAFDEVAAEQAPEPAPQPEPQEPSLFEPAAQEQGFAPAAHDDGFPPLDEPAHDYGVQHQEPAPAARPAQPAARHSAPDDPAEFVAPRRAAPGTPSPDALRRLQTAVEKTPKQEQRQQAQPAAAASRDAGQGADRSRFGINSLINRMTGHGAADAAAEQRAARRQPPVSSEYDEDPEGDTEQERIEIPAFLRRQAN